jgi:membrane protease YdiL (CAAX protease family)
MNPIEPSATKAYPGFAQALLVVFLFFLFTNLLAIPSVVLSILRHPHWAAWALFGGQLGGAALTLKVCLPLGGRTWADAFPSRLVARGVWPTAFVVSAGLILILNGLDAWVANVIPPPAWLHRVFTDMGWPSLVLGAPLTEEPLFRGLILGGFALRYGPRKGIIYTALFFALVHLNPWQFPTGLLMGAFLGWLTLRTGSLWPVVFAHFLNNLAASLCQRFTIPYLSDSRFQPLWMWALGFLLVGVGLAALIRSTSEALPIELPRDSRA